MVGGGGGRRRMVDRLGIAAPNTCFHMKAFNKNVSCLSGPVVTTFVPCPLARKVHKLGG